MNIYALLCFFVFLVYLYLIVFVLWKDPKSWLNRTCVALLACFAIWSFGLIFIYNLRVSKDTVMLFDNVGSIGWISFASFFLWFALIFTEKKILKSKIFHPLIFILPLLLIYKQWTGFLTVDYIKLPWGWGSVWSDSIWAYLFYLYYLSFMAIGLYLILNFGRKTEEPPKKKQAKIIFVTALASLVFSTFTDVVLPELNIRTIPSSLGNVITLIWASGIVYAIVKYKLMVITPATAADNIISTMADSLILLDRQGNIVSMNKAALDLSGYRKDELKGKSVEMFFAEKDFKNTLLDKTIKKEAIRNYELGFKTKTKDVIPTLISSSTMMGEAGGMAGIVCIVRDITERKQNEKLQEVLYNISKAANSPITLGQIYKTIHQELSTIIDTTNFYIALVDEKEDKIFFPYNVDNTKPIHLPRSVNHSSLVAQVIKTGKPIFANQEMIKGGKFMGEIKEWFGTLRKVWLGVPLKVADRVLGAMVVQSYTHPDLYYEKDIKLLEFVSSQVATAIKRKETEEQLKFLSFHDKLTGLYNRAYFEEELKRLNSERQLPISIIMADINGLKLANDMFGHKEGDILLCRCARIFEKCFRKEDIISRWGGDEFIIMLPKTTDQKAINIINRIEKECSKSDGQKIPISVSMGISTKTEKDKNINDVVIEAEEWMYKKKLIESRSSASSMITSFREILFEKSVETEEHTERTNILALQLGKHLNLSENELAELSLLSTLHDIGKVAIPEEVLLRQGKLSENEWKLIKKHPEVGYKIAISTPYLSHIANAILTHHEWWDGSGYPQGLKGEKIPLTSRILAIVDAYDVMTHDRSYRKAISKEEALEELKRCAGTQFDPNIVKNFLYILQKK